MSESWLAGKTVLITGSTSGLGREFAWQCAEQGANVVVNGRDPDPIRDLVKDMQDRHFSVFGIGADVTHPVLAKGMVKRAVHEFGGLHMVMNTVGSSGVRGPILEASPEEVQNLVLQDICSTINTTRAALPHLTESQGRVVNIGSIASFVAAPNYGAYPVAKHGVAAVTQQMRMENPGVSFTLACPGPIRDPLKNREPGGAELAGLDPRQLAEDILHAARKRKREIVRPRSARIVRALLQVCPPLGERLVKHLSGGQNSEQSGGDDAETSL